MTPIEHWGGSFGYLCPKRLREHLDGGSVAHSFRGFASEIPVSSSVCSWTVCVASHGCVRYMWEYICPNTCISKSESACTHTCAHQGTLSIAGMAQTVTKREEIQCPKTAGLYSPSSDCPEVARVSPVLWDHPGTQLSHLFCFPGGGWGDPHLAHSLWSDTGRKRK